MEKSKHNLISLAEALWDLHDILLDIANKKELREAVIPIMVSRLGCYHNMFPSKSWEYAFPTNVSSWSFYWERKYGGMGTVHIIFRGDEVYTASGEAFTTKKRKRWAITKLVTQQGSIIKSRCKTKVYLPKVNPPLSDFIYACNQEINALSAMADI